MKLNIRSLSMFQLWIVLGFVVLAGLGIYFFSGILKSSAETLVNTSVMRTKISATQFTPPQTVKLTIQLARPASSLNVDVKNASNLVVDTAQLTPTSSRNQYLKWDGKDANGNIFPQGEYTIIVTAFIPSLNRYYQDTEKVTVINTTPPPPPDVDPGQRTYQPGVTFCAKDY